jgi:hypothetical protein
VLLSAWRQQRIEQNTVTETVTDKLRCEALLSHTHKVLRNISDLLQLVDVRRCDLCLDQLTDMLTSARMFVCEEIARWVTVSVKSLSP